ncbi:MAG TPA: glycosyltransferase, partial [Tepidisphaeraceae bacterium]
MFGMLKVSFVISTHNRCDVLLMTLERLQHCGLDRAAFDIHVVDNASRDGTVARIRSQFPKVKVYPLKTNRGSVAKNVAVAAALGQYVVFLDDDSYPTAGSVARMIQHFEADAKLGAATFTITLPDGRRECSAYPDVFIGCGVGFRRRVLRLLGGLPDDFFMQAEEYDLSLKLLDAGWRVRTFDDLHVMHLKTP